MKKKQILNSALYFFLGALTLFITYNVINIVKVANQKVIVDEEWLEKKLFPDAYKEEYIKNNTLEDSIFKSIEYVFKDKNKKILGYDFGIFSGYEGYAKIIYDDKDSILRYEIYSIYATNLYDDFVPTSLISLFHYNDQVFVYDSFQDELYVVLADKKIHEVKKGN